MEKIGCGKETGRIDKALNRFTEIANVESAAIHCFTFVYQTDGRSTEKNGPCFEQTCAGEKGGS